MKTLFLYLFIEAISLFFMYLAEKRKIKENDTIKAERKSKFKIKRSTIFIFLSAIPLILLVGLRNINVGLDTYSAVAAFKRVITNTMSLNDGHWLSYGYIILLKIIGSIFGFNYVALNLILVILSIIFLYKTIWENSSNKTLSLYLFFSSCLLYQMMNQSRQQLAIMIVFWGFKFLKDRKFFKYFLTILLASSIHESAIIMLPFYFLVNKSINKKNLFIYFLIAIVILTSSEYITNILLYTDYGKIYLPSNLYNDATKAYYNLIIRLLMLFFALIFKDKNNSSNENKCLYNLALWCIISQVITCKIYAFGRITTYFFVFFFLLLPESMNVCRKKTINGKLINALVILGFFIYHIAYYILTGQLEFEYKLFL